METNVQTPASPKTATTSTAPVGGLPRVLGPVMGTALVIGTVIGSGVFRKPSIIADSVPSFAYVALVWILGGVLALVGALAIAEVAVLYPREGGNLVYLREGYGRLWAFLWGWVEIWIIRTASIAALATAFTQSFHDVIRECNGYARDQRFFSVRAEIGITAIIIVALALVNIRGVKWGGVLQVFITTVKVATLLAILILPFVLWGRAQANSSVTPAASLPAFSFGGLGAAMLGVLWAYHGWMNVTMISGEIRQPQRNIPISVIGGVGVVIFLYLGANVAYHLVIPQQEMSQLRHVKQADSTEDLDIPVVAEFARRLLGPIGVILASAALMCSTFGALNGNLLAGPRALYALGEDRMAPKALSEVHPTFKTPALAIAVEAAWACLLVLGGAALSTGSLPVIDVSPTREINFNLPANKPLFDILTDFAMFGSILFETLALSTIFVFRMRQPNAERPYRCIGYPLVPIIYVAVMSVVAINTLLTQTTEAMIGLIFISVGALVYVLFVPKTAPNLQ